MKRCFTRLHPNILEERKKSKKCNPKINPKTKGRKKVHFFPVQASSGRQRLRFPRVHFEKSAARRRLVREKTLISVEVLKQSGSLFLSSRWPRRRWPSCHRILSRCICHLLRCRSSGRRTTPSTVERKENRITTEYSKSSFLLCRFSGSQSWTQYFNHKERKLCDLFSTMWVHSCLIQSDYSWISCPTVLQEESADVTLAQGQNINQKSELEKPRLAF